MASAATASNGAFRVCAGSPGQSRQATGTRALVLLRPDVGGSITGSTHRYSDREQCDLSPRPTSFTKPYAGA